MTRCCVFSREIPPRQQMAVKVSISLFQVKFASLPLLLPQTFKDAIITATAYNGCQAKDCIMTTQQPGQRLDDLVQPQKRKTQSAQRRWLIALIVLLVIAAGTIFWLVDT